MQFSFFKGGTGNIIFWQTCIIFWDFTVELTPSLICLFSPDGEYSNQGSEGGRGQGSSLSLEPGLDTQYTAQGYADTADPHQLRLGQVCDTNI